MSAKQNVDRDNRKEFGDWRGLQKWVVWVVPELLCCTGRARSCPHVTTTQTACGVSGVIGVLAHVIAMEGCNEETVRLPLHLAEMAKLVSQRASSKSKRATLNHVLDQLMPSSVIGIFGRIAHPLVVEVWRNEVATLQHMQMKQDSPWKGTYKNTDHAAPRAAQKKQIV